MFSSTVYDTTDRKSTRLNSSHLVISYAVFCLKKKKHNKTTSMTDYTHQARAVTRLWRCTHDCLSHVHLVPVLCSSWFRVLFFFFFFFFKWRGPPKFFPFSPTRPFPV